MTKLTPRQILILSQLGSVSKTEASVAYDANLRTAWPAETARKHLMALRKLGMAVETKTRLPAHSIWRITPAGREALASPVHPQGS